jgi:hypothetical protein
VWVKGDPSSTPEPLRPPWLLLTGHTGRFQEGSRGASRSPAGPPRPQAATKPGVLELLAMTPAAQAPGCCHTTHLRSKPAGGRGRVPYPHDFPKSRLRNQLAGGTR